MTQQTLRSTLGSRFAALCAVALISLSGALLLQMGQVSAPGMPGVEWMFGPAPVQTPDMSVR